MTTELAPSCYRRAMLGGSALSSGSRPTRRRWASGKFGAVLDNIGIVVVPIAFLVASFVTGRDALEAARPTRLHVDECHQVREPGHGGRDSHTVCHVGWISPEGRHHSAKLPDPWHVTQGQTVDGWTNGPKAAIYRIDWLTLPAVLFLPGFCFSMLSIEVVIKRVKRRRSTQTAQGSQRRRAAGI